MAFGRKTGGRKKGIPNKITGDTRQMIARILENLVPEVEGWLREAAQGIEIEKTLANGQTVIGRFNADPAKAADVTLKLAEYCIPKVARKDVTLQDISDADLWMEVKRRLELTGHTGGGPHDAGGNGALSLPEHNPSQ
jgi:hypothetical protein